MRAERLYNAIIEAVEMDDIDKANLRETLHNIGEAQLAELEDIYIHKNY